MSLKVGDTAPVFELPNQFGAPVVLSELLERSAVAVVFFPLAFSQTCTNELDVLRDNLDLFTSNGVELVGVSVDSKATLRAFSERGGYDFPLLSDFWPHGAVADSYGAFLPDRGYATRATFLIDESGIIRSFFSSEPGRPRPLES